jgi:hypothetical protein
MRGEGFCGECSDGILTHDRGFRDGGFEDWTRIGDERGR